MRTAILSCLLCLSCLAAARADTKLQWQLELPARKQAWANTQRTRPDVAYPLLVTHDLVVTGCEYNGAVLAVDLATGDEQWRFYTEAPVRVAPITDGKRIFATSDDGYLYALDTQGNLQWKFRGGPGERKVIGHERLISAWPGASMALDRNRIVFVAGQWPLDGVYIHALDTNTGEVIWTNSSGQYRPCDLIRIEGGNVFVYGYGSGAAYDAATGRTITEKRPKLTFPEPVPVPEGVEDTVVDSRMHGDRQIVVTAEGGIYCFANRDPQRAATDTLADAEPDEAVEPSTGEAAETLLEKTGVREGYALVLGLRDGSLVEGLLRGSELRVVAVDADAKKVDAIRRRLDAAGLFDDHRLSIYQGDPAKVGLPPYIASLITSETNLELTDALRECLRPYGGTFAVVSGNKLTIQRRNGPVPGAGQWTHEYATAGNTLASEERVACAPLGILWYEGPAGAARFYFDGLVDHQSGHGVSPLPPGALIVDDRMILQGPGRLGAFDIYTGRLLWETELPEVYGFGGPEGGVGIHSRKHREPWRYEPAMKAEIPATHHSRCTGLNYAAAGDGVYLCAGRQLLCVSLEDGSVRSAWKVPLPVADQQSLCWGSVRVMGDRLVATAFRPQDLVDAQCGHDGNGGDWAKDRMPMTYLVVLDRNSGKLLWNRQAQLGFLNRGIAVGKDTVFCVDTIAPHTLEKLKEAKRRLPNTSPKLYGLDLANGKPRWQFEPGVAVLNLTYADRRDLLIVPCRNLITWQDGGWVIESASEGGKPNKSAPGRMWGLRGKSGEVAWSVDEAAYYEPHIVLGDVILDRNGYCYDLASGKRNLRVDPLTGQKGPWHFRKGGCNHLVACPTLVTWRTAYYDLADHSGSMPLLGMNTGCAATMLPAGGLLNVPNFGTHHKRSRMTALALVHQPENQLWTQYQTSREKTAAPPAAIRRAGFNFAAPGDRFADDGTLWLSVAPRKTENLEMTPKEADWFQLDPQQIGSWIAASGAQGILELSIPMVVTTDKNARRDDEEVRHYDVRLHFTEPSALRPGQRVFTVSLEGEPVLKNLDIAKAAGGANKPLVRELKNVEVQGALDLSFAASKGEPVLCGVEVVAR